MPRKSKIEQLGIGDKIVGYAVSGLSVPQIIAKLTVEHGNLLLTDTTVDRYIKRRSRDIREQKGVVADNGLLYTADSVKAELQKTLYEIRDYIEKWTDDPRAGASGLKLKIDALEKIAKWIPGYVPQSQVNVAVKIDGIQCQGCPFATTKAQVIEFRKYLEELDKAEVKDASAKS
jgi:hypothetical protein